MTEFRSAKHSRRGAWLIAAAAVLLFAAMLGRDWSAAEAIVTPTVFTVDQSPAGPANVQPGDPVSYTINFTASAAPPNQVGDLRLSGSLPPGLVIANFNSTYAGVCSGIGSASFSCDLGSVSASVAILPLLVNTTVVNVANGTTIDLALSNFVAKDSAFDSAPVNPTGNDPDVLTVVNEDLTSSAWNVTAPAVFEGGADSATSTITNAPDAASQAFTFTVTTTNAAVTGMLCPPGFLASYIGGTGTCSGGTMLPSASGQLTVQFAATDQTGVPANVAISVGASAGVYFTAPAPASVSVTQLGIAAGGPLSVSTGTPVTVCSVNNPNSSLLKGASSSSQSLQLADFSLQASGGAAVSGLTLLGAAACGTNQQGVTFTSNSQGAIGVVANTNAYTGGTGTSNTVTFSFGTPNNPMPSTSSISPTSANAGSAGFTLTVNGSGFVASSTVQWNGSGRPTSYVSPNQLTASITAADVLSQGTANVIVVNPLPGGGTSNAQTFSINAAPNPVPAISSVTPTSATAGGPQFTLSVTGSSFIASSQVKWNGSPRTTQYVDGTHVTATILASDIAAAGAANVSVFNPGPGGGDSATTVPFTINSAATKLGFTTQPGTGVAGSALGSQPVVAVQTDTNATVTTDSSTVVTLSLVGSGTLTCTGGLTKTASAGVASFAGCSVAGAATGLAIMASASGLNSATSSTFDVTAAPPASSDQLVVVAPAAGVFVPRSRLTFTATTGTLSPAPTALTLVIKRKSDNKYWDATAGVWGDHAVENATTAGSASGSWSLAITGAARRSFVNTTVVVTAHASAGGTAYVSAASPEIAVR